MDEDQKDEVRSLLNSIIVKLTGCIEMTEFAGESSAELLQIQALVQSYIDRKL